MRGSPDAVTVATERTFMPVSSATSCSAVRVRSSSMMLRRWPVARACEASSRAWSAASRQVSRASSDASAAAPTVGPDRSWLGRRRATSPPAGLARGVEAVVAPDEPRPDVVAGRRRRDVRWREQDARRQGTCREGAARGAPSATWAGRRAGPAGWTTDCGSPTARTAAAGRRQPGAGGAGSRCAGHAAATTPASARFLTTASRVCMSAAIPDPSTTRPGPAGSHPVKVSVRRAPSLARLDRRDDVGLVGRGQVPLDDPHRCRRLDDERDRARSSPVVVAVDREHVLASGLVGELGAHELLERRLEQLLRRRLAEQLPEPAGCDGDLDRGRLVHGQHAGAAGRGDAVSDEAARRRARRPARRTPGRASGCARCPRRRP